MGFEPTYNGFAIRCLTTWLPHPNVRTSRTFAARAAAGGETDGVRSEGSTMPQAGFTAKAQGRSDPEPLRGLGIGRAAGRSPTETPT